MAQTMEKFLKKYYKQLHFNSMPAPVRKHFFEWVKKGTLTKDMELWVRDYLKHNPDGTLTQDANKNYIPNELPDPNVEDDLPEDEARELFSEFQKAFARMDAGKNSFKDKDSQSLAFLNQYFGPEPGKLFKTAAPTSDCQDGIAALLELLKDKQIQEHVCKNTIDSEGKPIFKNDKKLKEDLIDKCAENKHLTDASVQDKLKNVAETLLGVVNSITLMDKDSHIYQVIKANEERLQKITADNAFQREPTADELKRFREFYLKAKYTDPGSPGLLQTLYYNKKVRECFAKYDHGVITGTISEAEEKVNWKDNVDAKIDDVLTPVQQLQKWTSDTYNDTIKKYEELRGAPLFKKAEAKAIFKAIDKVKLGDGKKGIRPSDGLGAILNNKDAIKKEIDDPRSKEHFDWFIETMTTIQSKMPKAIDGSWNNATQMKAVITQVILKATEPGATEADIEKAKTTMEIMTAMKYGMLTSRVMDALKKEEFKIFSDGGLSWNNNEATQFLTKALDKSVRAAFLGVGYAVTFARNKIMMSGMKFTNANNKRGALGDRFNEENQNRKQELINQNEEDKDKRTENQTILTNLASSGINETNIATHKTTRDGYKAIMDAQESIMETNRAGYDRYNQAQEIIDADTTLKTRRADAITEKTNLQNSITDPVNGLDAKIAALQSQLANPATFAGMAPAYATVQAQNIQKEIDRNEETKANVEARIAEQDNIIADVNAQLADPDYVTNLSNANTAKTANTVAHSAYTTAETTYNTTKASYDPLNNKVKQFEDAKAAVEELTNNINERNDALAHWPKKNTNRLVQLENYWNWLQTGDLRSFRFSAQNAQDDFDKNSENLWLQYQASHGLQA